MSQRYPIIYDNEDQTTPSTKVDLHSWTSEVFLDVQGGPTSLSTTHVATFFKVDLPSSVNLDP